MSVGEVAALTDFGDELEELRRARGLSYRQLAAKAGLDAGYVCHLVKGRRGHQATDLTIERLANALDVEPAHFRDYRQRRVLEQLPDEVDELYRRLAG